jgi:hypothetical protein
VFCEGVGETSTCLGVRKDEPTSEQIFQPVG